MPRQTKKQHKVKPAASKQRSRKSEYDELVHELRTYREETRVQTEQLLKSQSLLEDSRNQYADLFDFAPIPYLTLDRWGVVRAINLTGAALLAVERARIVGLPLRYFLIGESRAKFLAHMIRCRKESGRITTEITIQSGEGLKPVQLVSRRSTRADENGWSYLTTIQDLSEREKQEQLRNTLMRQLLDAQEHERHRLSRELHDEMGQHVTALILGLQQIRRQSEASAVRPNVEQLLEIANQIGHQTHRVALNLRPTALDDLGLQAALANYIEDWSRTSGVRTELQYGGNTAERLPSDIETTIYRVVQEALTNVARHAQASRASVIVHWDSKEAHAIVEDDGHGFDAAMTLRESQSNGRLGLLGMQERARLAGGAFELESRPGYGTTVFVRVPAVAQAMGGNNGYKA